MDSRELIEKINSINEMNVLDLEEGTNPRKRVPASGKKTSTNKTSTNKSTIKKTSSAKSSNRYKKSSKKKHSKQKSIDLFNKSAVSVIIAAAAVMIFAISGIGYAIWYYSFTELSLSEYASVVLSGYDEYGSAQLTMEKDPEYSEFFSTVKAELNYSENLSNGDEIVISYAYDEQVAKDNKLRIDDSEAHITVDGLFEARHITKDDIFAGLNITFSGIAPLIEVEVENISEEAPFNNIEYSIIDDKGFYDNGEEINICATIPGDDLANHAYIFDLSEQDYVSGFTTPYGDRYFTDASQVTEDILAELEQKGFELISQSDAKEYGLRIFQGEAKLQPVFVGNKTTFQWANPYVISAYFHNVTDEGKSLLESHANDVQIVYGITLTQADGTSVLVEMVIQFKDLLTHEDGTVDNALDSGRIVSVSYKDSNIKSLVNDEADGTYVTTKITN